ncbi:murein hydrolase activator EnvC family protein [Streptomyces nigrescens]
MRRNTRRNCGPTRAFHAFTGLRGRLPRPVDRRQPRPRPRPRSQPGRGPGPLPPPRLRSPSRPHSRFRSPAPLTPAPRRKPNGYGPSCFFPAHAAGALLAPTAAAVLTLFTPALANAAAASSVSAATGHGVARGVEGGAERGLGAVAGRPLGRGIDRVVSRAAGRAAGREVDVERGEMAGRAEGGAPAARAAPPAEDRSWPVGGAAGVQPTVVRGWEPPPAPWAAGHRGVDLAASAGAVVRAAAPGRVAYAGTVAGRGVLTLEVSRSGRPPLRTSYEPVRSTVRKGQRVTAGQPVAVLQHGGPFHCREPCLHWGLRRGKTYLDPLSLLPPSMLGGGPSRLLPIFGVPVPAGGHTAPRPPEPPEPTAQASSSAPTAAALTEAVGLAAVTIWALGRLPAARSAVSDEGTPRRRWRGWGWRRRVLGRGGE